MYDKGLQHVRSYDLNKKHYVQDKSVIFECQKDTNIISKEC